MTSVFTIVRLSPTQIPVARPVATLGRKRGTIADLILILILFVATAGA
jgi:hypothetical protein